MTISKDTGIAFERTGQGDPLLLIHGTGGARHVWTPVVDRLASQRELLLVDLPGHGESASPEEPEGLAHTPIGYAEKLARLLDELGFESVDVAGNSVGGWTALELAKLGRARSVVALAPAGLWGDRNPLSSRSQLWLNKKGGALFRGVTPHLLRTEIGRELLMRNTVAKPRQISPEAAIEIAETYDRTPAFDVHLRSTSREHFRDGRGIGVPVTVVWGEKERLIPPRARRRDELPPQTRFVTLPGCGHLMMWDDPEGVVRVILEGAQATAAASARA